MTLEASGGGSVLHRVPAKRQDDKNLPAVPKGLEGGKIMVTHDQNGANTSEALSQEESDESPLAA